MLTAVAPSRRSQVETLAAQVRRCARCGEPAAILVRVLTADDRRWEPGDRVPPPSTCRRATFRCQSCGAVLEHVPVGARRVLLVAPVAFGALVTGFGTLLVIALTIAGSPDGGLDKLACLAPLFAVQFVPLAIVLWRSIALRRWPVVDAPRPALTRRAPEAPWRRCSCGEPARVVAVVQERVRGAPVGRVYEHSCSTCKRTFVVYGRSAIAFAMVASAFLTGAAAVFLLHPQNVWVGVVLAAASAFGWALSAARIVGRFRHPEVRPIVF